MSESKMITVQDLGWRVKDFFFEAMADGYAASKTAAVIPQVPGSKLIGYQMGQFRLLDTWISFEGSIHSTGITLIWYTENGQEIPVWAMHYGGYYVERAIPFLKECLASAYRQQLFFGGRGPTWYKDEETSLLYINQPNKGHFGNFKGEENIYDQKNNLLLGHHWYRGHYLID